MRYSKRLHVPTFQTSSLPFTSGLLSCSLWLRYGVLIKENTIILVNAIGVFLFVCYCISYFVFTVNKERMMQQLMLVLLMITFAIGYSWVEPDDQQASQLIGELAYQSYLNCLIHHNDPIPLGLMCCSVGVFFFASPLIKLKHVIATRNTECLPFPIILASFFVTLQWFIYGYLISDSFIQVSCAI